MLPGRKVLDVQESNNDRDRWHEGTHGNVMPLRVASKHHMFSQSIKLWWMVQLDCDVADH